MDRPILFSGPMVRAILEDRKTMTRRVLVPQPPGTKAFQIADLDEDGVLWMSEAGTYCAARIPYAVSDRLWVREAHAIVPRTAYRCSEGVQQTLRPDDNCDAAVYREGWERSKPGSWRPGIHMHRWASRITCVVTDVKVERLQEISEADAIAEGCPGRLGPNPDFPDEWDPAPVEEFRDLWDSLNAKRGFGWDANPWLVAVRFETHKCNIDQMERAA